MAMSRSDATSYLASTLTQWLTDAGLGNTDVSGSLKEPIDNALLMIGTDYGDLATASVANADALAFRKVLDYAGLLRVQQAIGSRVDIQLDGPQMSKSRSQAVRQIAGFVDDARKAAEPYMSSGDFATGTVTFDFLEPVEV